MSRSFGRCRAAFALFCAVIAGSAIPAHGQQTDYSFTKVHFPGSIYTEISGINNSGEMVGTYVDSAGITHGMYFDGTNYVTIDFPGAVHNYAFGISHTGQIVGSHAYTDAIGPWHAFLKESGTFVEFDYPARETDVRGMNSLGHMVGIYNAGYGTPDHGFVKVGDTYSSIDYPGASVTYTFGINDAGLVTGTYRTAQRLLRGFTYLNGVYRQVNFPGASETYVGGVNNSNTTVGWAIQGTSTNAFVASGLRFRTFIAPFAGVTSTKGRAINDLGEVVGTYTSPECSLGCGFVARPVPTGTALCRQTVVPTYANGTLNLSFSLQTSVPTTWTSWVFLQGVPYRLWSLPIGILAQPTPVNVPITLQPSGSLLILSTLATASAGNVCADYASVNTGPGSPP